MKSETIKFGQTKEGEDVFLYRLQNEVMSVDILNYGCIIRALKIGGTDVVLGYDDVASYEEDQCFFGAVVGRCANRVGQAGFTLNGVKYDLTSNAGAHSLHGGRDFYGKRLWKTESVEDHRVKFSLESPHMDQGYPGNVKIEVTYEISEEGALDIIYKAVPDQDTVINLTNHSYFNLAGHDSGRGLDQRVRIEADAVSLINEEMISTGEIRDVQGTPFDFREEKRIDRGVGPGFVPMVSEEGYDCNFALRGTGYREAASLYSEKTGIRMRVYTDLPGMQFYTGGQMGRLQGKDGAVYDQCQGVCFESQHFPDAVNHTQFPSAITRKKEVYHQRTTYKFDAI